MTRHKLDISKAEIHVLHGHCTIRGTITAEQGSNIDDVEAEVQRVALLIRHSPSVKNVTVELSRLSR